MVGSKHTIKGLDGGYFIDLTFQDTLQLIGILRDYTDIAHLNTTNKYDELFFSELLRDELITKGFAEEKQVSVCGDPHYVTDYSVYIEYKKPDPDIYKTHNIWAD